MLKSENIMNESAGNLSSSGMLIGSLVATIIIALITAYVAYLNYCSRPYLLSIKEKHTNELKELLQRWLLFIEQVSVFSLEENKRVTEDTPFGDSALFKDLISNHDSELGIYRQWYKVKKLTEEFNADMLELDNSIRQDANAALESRKVRLYYEYYRCIYEQSVAIAKGKKLHHSIDGIKINVTHTNRDGKIQSDTIVTIESCGLLVKAEEHDEAQAAMDYFKNVLSQLCNNTSKEYRYVEIAIRAAKLEHDLHNEYNKLRQLIDEMLAIPIFVDECKHVLRSVPPIFPSRRWWRFKWNKYIGRIVKRIVAHMIESAMSGDR